MQSSTIESFGLLDNILRLDKVSLSMVDDLDGMAVFVAVAETKGFRSAGQRRHTSPPLRAFIDYLRRARRR